jgi:hypothetical protein
MFMREKSKTNNGFKASPSCSIVHRHPHGSFIWPPEPKKKAFETGNGESEKNQVRQASVASNAWRGRE